MNQEARRLTDSLKHLLVCCTPVQRGEAWDRIIFYMMLDIYTQDMYTSSFGFLLRKIEAWECTTCSHYCLSF